MRENVFILVKTEHFHFLSKRFKAYPKLFLFQNYTVPSLSILGLKTKDVLLMNKNVGKSRRFVHFAS